MVAIGERELALLVRIFQEMDGRIEPTNEERVRCDKLAQAGYLEPLVAGQFTLSDFAEEYLAVLLGE